MTNNEKEIIIAMRKSKCTYAVIAEKTGLSVSAIKTFCHRCGITMPAPKVGSFCKNCGKEIERQPTPRTRLFCCDQCKQAWWNKHRQERVSKNQTTHICATCGKSFNDYPGANRKYCSQTCYRERNHQNG